MREALGELEAALEDLRDIIVELGEDPELELDAQREEIDT
jgi:hypothetical protein